MSGSTRFSTRQRQPTTTKPLQEGLYFPRVLLGMVLGWLTLLLILGVGTTSGTGLFGLKLCPIETTPMPVVITIQRPTATTTTLGQISVPYSATMTASAAEYAKIVTKPINSGQGAEVREYGQIPGLSPNGLDQNADGVFLWVQGIYESQPYKWVVRIPNQSCNTGALSLRLNSYRGKGFWIRVDTDSTVQFFDRTSENDPAIIWWSCEPTVKLTPQPTVTIVPTHTPTPRAVIPPGLNWPPSGCEDVKLIPEMTPGDYTFADASIWWGVAERTIVVRANFTKKGEATKQVAPRCYKFLPRFGESAPDCRYNDLALWRFSDDQINLSYLKAPDGSGGASVLMLSQKNFSWSCPEGVLLK